MVLGIAATILVTVVALGAIGGMARSGTVAASPAAPSPALATPNPSAGSLVFDPTLDGPGVSTSADGSPAALIDLAVLALLGCTLALRGRRRFLPLAPMLALIGYGLVAINLPVDLRITGWAPGLAIREATMPSGATEVLWYEVAPAGGRFSIGLDLIAVDSVPVTIDGIVEPDGEGSYHVTWRAVWLDEQIGGGSTGPGSPFVPFELRQRDQMIWLVGRASACAMGPTFDGATSGSMGFDGPISGIDVRVTVLGWPRVVRLELPMQLLGPMANPCPEDVVGTPPSASASPSTP